MTELATPSTLDTGATTVAHPRITIHVSWVSLFLLLAAIGVVTFVLAPLLLWAYNTDQAGRAMERGMVWREPRRSDSLPEQRDAEALALALRYLAAAQNRQPEHAQSYRLAGQVYVAQQDWQNAATSFVQARERDPQNPLLAWESALAYEQMQRIIETAPRENILPDLVSAPIEPQSMPQESESCYGDRPATCYIGLDTWQQPYAALPDAPEISHDVLVMHAPAGLRLTLNINASHSALSFLIALDPRVGAGQSDGATYSIAVESLAGREFHVYERTVSRDEVLHGWIPEMVDLTPWAGQSITLIFRLKGGPAGNTHDDWYGWGNVLLTTPEAAQAALSAPAAKLREAWDVAGMDAEQFVAMGDAALQTLDYNAAVDWYSRSQRLTPTQSFELSFRHAIAAVMSNRSDAQTLIDQARAFDPSLAVFDLTRSQRIDGASLRWMTPFAGFADYGEPLSFGTSGDVPAGYMWWSGQAVAVVQAPHAGQYQLRVRSVHSSPPPIELAIGIDGQQLQKVTLARGDNFEETLSLTVTLSQGLHSVNVWYLNDSLVNGIDRNAVIQWITVEEHKP